MLFKFLFHFFHCVWAGHAIRSVWGLEDRTAWEQSTFSLHCVTPRIELLSSGLAAGILPPEPLTSPADSFLKLIALCTKLSLTGKQSLGQILNFYRPTCFRCLRITHQFTWRFLYCISWWLSKTSLHFNHSFLMLTPTNKLVWCLCTVELLCTSYFLLN